MRQFDFNVSKKKNSIIVGFQILLIPANSLTLVCLESAWRSLVPLVQEFRESSEYFLDALILGSNFRLIDGQWA
ncbi:MAG: hypothetical protein HKP31_08415 [Nitrosopumilus sp.]|nr:hypothetical protein [Nitrosopumilus sp.]